MLFHSRSPLNRIRNLDVHHPHLPAGSLDARGNDAGDDHDGEQEAQVLVVHVFQVRN